ncbi:MAG: YjfB family protein [Acetatifactor sp.]|nr:YjfB family protein [Acetatifactor sp.]
MDVAGLSMSMAAGKVQNQVSIAVLSKAMDTNEALGQGLVEMIDAAAMERSVNPSVGANFDMRV